jgi:outer membrane protein OmpA-like peptidoglycan-associated protein
MYFISKTRFGLLTVMYATLLGCSTTSSIQDPDKTVSGGVLGSAWGASAGAIVGHQTGATGEGLAVGAGLGLLSGAMTGLGYDILENDNEELQEELNSLKLQNVATLKSLATIQEQLDYAEERPLKSQVHTVYFDPDTTGLRNGAISGLEVIADAIATSPYIRKIIITGHTDDTGTPEYNKKVAEERAKSVFDFLISRGVSNSRIELQSSGSDLPLATNATAEGRQLNRRVEISALP